MRHPVLTPTRTPVPPATDDAAASPEVGAPAPRRWWRLALHGLAPAALVVEAWLVLQYLLKQVTRPLWYDEQWRAYHFTLSGPEFYRELRLTNAPLAAGWVALEKLSTGLLGDREVPLRLPVVVAYLATGVVTYALARRFVGAPGGFLVAAGVLANASILQLGLQLKPFTIEVLAGELAMLLWLDADRPGRGLAGRLARYAGMGLAAVVGTAAAFVVGPLLLVDAARLARERTLRRLLPPLLAGVVVLVHLKAFVLLQTGQSRSAYWNAYFVPHEPFGDKVGFTLHGLAGFVPGVFLGDLGAARSGITRSLAFGSAATSMLVPFMVVALALGVVAALRSGPGRTLLAVLGLSLDAQLLASSMRLWPFGFARTNLFLVPFAYLLAGVGVAWPLSALLRLATGGRRRARSWLEAGPAARWAMRRLWALWLAAPDRLAPLVAPERVRRLVGRPLSRGLVAAALAVLAALAAVNLVSVGEVSVRQLRLVGQASDGLPYGGELRGLVRTVRLRDTPTDVVVHVGSMSTKGWHYYMQPGYDGYSRAVSPRSAIGPDRTVTTDDPVVLWRFLAAHRGAAQAFVVVQQGESKQAIDTVYRVLNRAGYRDLVNRDQAGVTMVLQLARRSRTPR